MSTLRIKINSIKNNSIKRILIVSVAALMGHTVSAAPAPATYYVEPGTYGTQREPDPPAYVRNFGENNWLQAGYEYRLRYEYRDDDIRRIPVDSLDKPLLQRVRAYVGIKNVLDPLRFAVEFTDSRRNRSQFARDDRDVNEMEIIQGYAELYFPAALGEDPRGNARPVSFRAGRMAFEELDRRLVARNDWRNTTNNFDGLRLTLGQDSNDWELDVMSLRPVTRQLTSLDRPNQDQLFNAVIGHWRSKSPLLTVEPHFLQLRQHGSAANSNRERNIKAPGLRVYGRTGTTGVINYDVTYMNQFGHDGSEDQKAEALTAEVGYAWQQHPWRPRLSAFYGYASGDRTPLDDDNNRFERFFGFARPWSSDDYVIFENIHAPKLKIEFQPKTGWRVDAGYSAFWLASDQDRFSNLLAGTSANRDRNGRSGNFVGQGIDLRVRHNVTPQLLANVGYTHFATGDFVRNRQQAATGMSSSDSDFFYIEFTYVLAPDK
ncbi:MAG: alginate export family protein [Pseudomonadota bacterium]